MIKPLEKAKIDKWLVVKIIFLLVFTAGAVYANFFLSRRQKENKETLGVEQVNQLKRNSSDFSLEKAGERAKNLLNQTTKQIQEKADNVLGETIGVVSDTASKSAKIISDFIFDNTVKNIIKQIEKLPKEQKEKIKEYILNNLN